MVLINYSNKFGVPGKLLMENLVVKFPVVRVSQHFRFSLRIKGPRVSKDQIIIRGETEGYKIAHAISWHKLN